MKDSSQRLEPTMKPGFLPCSTAKAMAARGRGNNTQCLLKTISARHNTQKPRNDGNEGNERKNDGGDGDNHCP